MHNIHSILNGKFIILQFFFNLLHRLEIEFQSLGIPRVGVPFEMTQE